MSTKPQLVLDTNCIIDLEENRIGAYHLRRLISAWQSGRFDLAVVAVTASENQPSGRASPDFSEFEAKLERVGLANVHHLFPVAIWNVFYWDHALWPTTEFAQLADRIHRILFPGRSTCPPANLGLNSSWRNRMCDVMIAWACIHHEWRYLVTNDMNFHKHGHELAAIGLHHFLHPADAARQFACP